MGETEENVESMETEAPVADDATKMETEEVSPAEKPQKGKKAPNKKKAKKEVNPALAELMKEASEVKKPSSQNVTAPKLNAAERKKIKKQRQEEKKAQEEAAKKVQAEKETPKPVEKAEEKEVKAAPVVAEPEK